jgi:Cu+-exporting ATPase
MMPDKLFESPSESLSEKTYEIKGMTCAACVGRVEKVLRKNPDVSDVFVNLATERARVVFKKPVDDSVIISAIEKTGYLAKPYLVSNLKPEMREDSHEGLWLMLSAILTLPLLLPMIASGFGLNFSVSPPAQAGLAAIVQFGFGFRFYRGAFFALKSFTPNMDVLICLGTFAAFAFSVYHLMGQHAAHAHYYFETGAFVTTLVMLGKYLESQAKSATGIAIQKLKRMRPSVARVISNGHEEMQAIDLLAKGTLIRVLSGETIPVDGVVIAGESEVNEALLTGESLPVFKPKGAFVSGGSINLNGVLEIEVSGAASESLLSRIIGLIEKAQEKRAPIQRLADRISAVFVPVVLCLALGTLFLWGFITHDWEHAMINAVGVLVIACPCALGLATPTAVRVGMGAAARRGILIRDAEVLETLHALNEIAFDKTGTLTEGNFKIAFFKNLSAESDEYLKSILASLQSQSEHPLAKAIVDDARSKNIVFSAPESVRVIPGQGVEGNVNGRVYFFGNEQAIANRGLAIPTFSEGGSGETISYLLNTGTQKIMAAVGLSDEIRLGAKEAIATLHSQNILTALLSGDRALAAERVGKILGIDQIHAPLTPEAKTAFITQKISDGIKIGMVGDGLNDAPALAAATVGFALSSGTDVSISVAGVTLMRPDLKLIPESISLSKKIYRKIKQNLFWAFAYNVIGIPLAALGYLNPMLAGAAMALSSVSVVLN